MTSKVHLKWASLELEYEREETITIEDLAALIKLIETSTVTKAIPFPQNANLSAQVGDTSKPTNLALHINSVAQCLGVKSGPELVVAAAAYLQIVENKESFNRSELLSSMKQATKFFNKSMGVNLTRSVSALVGSKFNQIATDQYCLKQDEYVSLETVLAKAG